MSPVPGPEKAPDVEKAHHRLTAYTSLQCTFVKDPVVSILEAQTGLNNIQNMVFGLKNLKMSAVRASGYDTAFGIHFQG